LILCICLIGAYPSFAQFSSTTLLSQIPITVNTGEKPQSKIWAHGGKFWTVLPDNNGTHVWRLDGSVWQNILTISDKTTSKVDCKVMGNVTHVLLFHESTAAENEAFFDIVTLEYAFENEIYLSH